MYKSLELLFSKEVLVIKLDLQNSKKDPLQSLEYNLHKIAVSKKVIATIKNKIFQHNLMS